MDVVNFFGQLEQITRNGISENDQFLIRPFKGKQRKIKLNKVNYLIKTDSELNLIRKEGDEYSLPAIKGHDFQLKLHYQYISGNSGSYTLESLNKVPFRVNGVFTTHVWLQNGDVVDFGYNQLLYRKNISAKKVNVCDVLDVEVLKSDCSILIEGETGTGKTSLARDIHRESGRRGKFVHLNISSFSRNLLESELFGHIKGAFTGAVTNKKGAFLEASGGTLFLDEIDSLSLELQTKLLLVIESKSIRPVGSEYNIDSDVRIIIASGTCLYKLLENNQMRRDFFYRISSGLNIKLPSLREKPELIKTAIENFCSENCVYIPDSLLEFYQKQTWPGNYRQLLSHLHRKKMLTKGGTLSFENEDMEVNKVLSFINVNRERENPTLKEVSKEYARKVYFEMECNLAQTAGVLKISKGTLRRILEDVKSSSKHQLLNGYKYPRSCL